MAFFRTNLATTFSGAVEEAVVAPAASAAPASSFDAQFPTVIYSGDTFVQLLDEIVMERQISNGAFRLYAVLLSYSRGRGVCWPAQATLAAKLGVSERSTREWLKELEAVKLVKVAHRYGQGNIYYLLKLVRTGTNPNRESGRGRGQALNQNPQLPKEKENAKADTTRQLEVVVDRQGQTGSRLPIGPEADFRLDRKQVADKIYKHESYKKIYKHTREQPYPTNSNQTEQPGEEEEGGCVTSSKFLEEVEDEGSTDKPLVLIPVHPSPYLSSIPTPSVSPQSFSVCPDPVQSTETVKEEPKEARASEKEELEPDQAHAREEAIAAQHELGLIEQQIIQAGVSALRARQAALLAVRNGRSVRYVEGWRRWIVRQTHIHNPPAYLLSRIQENTDVPGSHYPSHSYVKSSYSHSHSCPSTNTPSWIGLPGHAGDNDVYEQAQEQEAEEKVVTGTSHHTEILLEQTGVAAPRDVFITEESAGFATATSGMACTRALKLVVDNTQPTATAITVTSATCLPSTNDALIQLVNDKALPLSHDRAATASGYYVEVEAKRAEVGTKALPVPKVSATRSTTFTHDGKVATAGSTSCVNTAQTDTTQKSTSWGQIDRKLQELLVQRDQRARRLKRLEVQGDTLMAAFWFSHEAADGPGASWLADAKFLYPQVSNVQILN